MNAYSKKALSKTQSVRLGFAVCCLLGACGTPQLKVDSNPVGAKVTIVDSSKALHTVGVTPIVLTPENAQGLYKSAIQVNVTKEGYKDQSVLVPETNVTSHGQLVVTLRKDDSKFLNSATEQVAQIQRLIFKKNYTEAEHLCQTSIAENPSISVFHSLLGNVYYLQKNTARALDSYERAHSIEPNNIDVSNMIQKLKGIRAPEGQK